MKTVTLPGGETVPALGQGTWNMAERPGQRAAEIAALREGVALGMTLIDTAEMYASGGAEALVGEAITGLRDQVLLVSKAYPQNASRSRLAQACEASLRRLGTDRIDLYLLHWRGAVPLRETVAAMQKLQEEGKIRYWGVSNLDTDDMGELFDAGGAACVTNQILYNLTRRWPERALLPWLARHGIPAMAYSPVEQGRLLTNRMLVRLARERGASPAQLALAWVLRRPGMIAIPKAGSVAHVQDNRAAAALNLSPDELAALEATFPAPAGRARMEML